MPFKSNKQRGWMHANKPEMAKKWEAEEKAVGGYLEGNSHEDGGIDINAEGGEYIITKNSVNRSTIDMLKYINQHGDLPMSDARNRSK
tara:strand:+ start:775 stop:1038 length:264 start_codon:yes stop_codon:yes gene_type:complete